jgi:hypothetical protein
VNPVRHSEKREMYQFSSKGSRDFVMGRFRDPQNSCQYHVTGVMQEINLRILQPSLEILNDHYPDTWTLLSAVCIETIDTPPGVGADPLGNPKTDCKVSGYAPVQTDSIAREPVTVLDGCTATLPT